MHDHGFNIKEEYISVTALVCDFSAGALSLDHCFSSALISFCGGKVSSILTVSLSSVCRRPMTVYLVRTRLPSCYRPSEMPQLQRRCVCWHFWKKHTPSEEATATTVVFSFLLSYQLQSFWHFFFFCSSMLIFLGLLFLEVVVYQRWCMLKATLLCHQVRQMAAVLLRRLLSSSFEEIYPGLTVSLQAAIKTELVAIIQTENTPNIRKKVCDVAAELSRNLVGMNRNVWTKDDCLTAH